MATVLPIVVAVVWFVVGWMARGLTIARRRRSVERFSADEFIHRFREGPNVIDLTGARRRERRP